MRRLTARILRSALVIGLLLTPVACGEPEKGKVTIMVPWSDTEFRAFYTVVKNFEHDHPGIDVEPQVTRALNQQLDAAVAVGAKPDLAVLSSVGAIAKYRKYMQRLDVDTSAYVQPFRGLGMSDGHVYAVPVKADVKSLIWYDARSTPKPASSVTALRSNSGHWCLGLLSGPTSGWPGADWIADILLADAGVKTYTDWASGKAPWHEGAVKEAWTAWGDLMGHAVLKNAPSLGFRDVIRGMLRKKCSLSHGALSTMAFRSAEVSDDQYTYVTLSSDTLQVSADFVGRFTEGNKSADEFIRYLASTEAQQTWVKQPGFALSADHNVTTYDNTTQGRIAAMLRSSRYTRCFSAADAMNPDVSAAFYRAVLDYANGFESPPSLLAALDKVDDELGYPRKHRLPALCSSPNSP
ncbi:ABC transporter substrate-binding protein [Streptomyces sp. NPDC020996]|uniref:ABC transporter substrate-binding protein n=1 Tax=Streptomyces sp. NPDC020996 TaxID=3154791 RepID=UPI0033CA13DB